MNIPRGHALIIADGRATLVPLAELERLKRGDTSVADEPIASMEVSAENVDEAIARVLDVLSKDEDVE